MDWEYLLKYDEGLHERQYDEPEPDWLPLIRAIKKALDIGVKQNQKNQSQREYFEEALEYLDDIQVLLEG
jgi:hypothetical protein